jgi:predicted RNase H-like HicB family nuclease
MKKADLYKKVVYWSREDNCFVGICPELMDGGIHGDDALTVFKELCIAVDETIDIYERDGTLLPNPRELEFIAA